MSSMRIISRDAKLKAAVDPLFVMGTVVWAKLHGFGHWPARIVDRSTIDPSSCTERCTDTQMFIRTFGDHMYIRVECSSLSAFDASCEPPASASRRQQQSKLYLAALTEAKLAIGIGIDHKRPAGSPWHRQEWECSYCTLLNHTKKCSGCSTPRRDPIVWACEVCTLENTEMLAHCRACKTPRAPTVLTAATSKRVRTLLDHRQASELLARRSAEDTKWQHAIEQTTCSAIASSGEREDGDETTLCTSNALILLPPSVGERVEVEWRCGGSLKWYHGRVTGKLGSSKQPLIAYDDGEVAELGTAERWRRPSSNGDVPTSVEQQADDDGEVGAVMASMRPICGAEFGCGSARLAKAAMRRGFEMITLDRDVDAPEYDDELLPRGSDSHWVRDLKELQPEELPTFHWLHFSPTCVSTTILAASRHQRTFSTDFQGKTAECQLWNDDMMTFYDIIKQQRRRPGNLGCAFTVEQPVGLARSTQAIRLFATPIESGGLGAIRCTLDACRHGASCKKPTDLWVGGLPNLIHALGTERTELGYPPPKWRCSKHTPCRFYPQHPQVRGNTKATCAFSYDLCSFLLAHIEADLCASRLQ